MTHSIKKLKSVPAETAVIESPAAHGYRVGRITGMCESGWLVDCGCGGAPVLARTTLALDAAAMSGAAAAQRSVLLVFDNEQLDRPIVVGLLAPPPGEATPVAKLDAVSEECTDGRRGALRSVTRVAVIPRDPPGGAAFAERQLGVLHARAGVFQGGRVGRPLGGRHRTSRPHELGAQFGGERGRDRWIFTPPAPAVDDEITLGFGAHRVSVQPATPCATSRTEVVRRVE